MTDVIVVGGGIAGLVAARHCAHLGLSVTIYEASDALGGAVASHEVAGLTLDSGAESFAVRKGTVADFIDGLHLTDQIVAPNPQGAWLYLPPLKAGGAPMSVPLPKTGILGIPGSPLADDVRRAIGTAGAWRAWLDRLKPVLTIGREHSLGDLVEKRMGTKVLERLVEPVAGGVYSTPAHDLEIDVVAPGLNGALTTAGSLSGAVLALRSQAPAGAMVGGLRGGMSKLVDAVRADLDKYDVTIVTDATVTGLIQNEAAGHDDGDSQPTWSVTLEQRAAATEAAATAADDAPEADTAPIVDTVEARFVIVAAPGAQAMNLVHGVSPELAAVADLDWPDPVAVELATLVVDAPELDSHPRGTGVLVAANAPGVTAKALTHVSAKWEWVAAAAGPGRHVIRLSYGRSGEPNLTDALSDEQFQELARHDASVILGVQLAADSVQGFARTAWRNALSPATLGARERVKAVRDALEQTPGLELTGAWLSGTGLAAVIPDAVDAASRIRQASLGL